MTGTTTSTTLPAGPTPPGARRHALRVGVRRGLTEFRLSLRAPEDIAFYVFWGAGALLFLWVNRDSTVEGVPIAYPALMLPGVLAAMTVFGALLGPAFALVLEREDGTLLRAKAAPYGMQGYVAGQVVLQTLGVVPMFVLLVVPSMLLFDVAVERGALGALAVAGFILLGLLAVFPLGMIIGSLARKPSHVSTWGMLPFFGLAAISGVFFPVAALWDWVQVVAQLFPVYWLGVGLRWAFLPDAAAAAELTGDWQLLEAVGVLGLWALAGLVVAPRVLRRMARRESGSAVEARRQERMQRLG